MKAEELVVWLRRQSGKNDALTALRQERALVDAALGDARDPRLVAQQAALARDPTARVRLGVPAGSTDDFYTPMKGLLAHHWFLGATGSGKTYFVLYLLLVLWWRHRGKPFAVVKVDAKGEAANLLLDEFLPALIGRLPRREAETLVRLVRVIDPFDANALPPLNVLVRDPSIPVEVQAMDVASSVIAAVGAGSGIRIDGLLQWLLRLVIQGNGTFLTVRRILQDDAALNGLVREVADPELNQYFAQRYPTEPKASKLALLARLDRLLALPATRACLSAKTCIDFGDVLDSGFTVVNLGRAPAGARETATFWATLVGTRLFRAVYRRPPNGGLSPAVVAIDEWQTLLTPSLADDVEQLLALARSRQVFLWLINQQVAQLKVSSSLREVVSGQTQTQVVFGATIEDARALKHILPVTGRARRPPPDPWDVRPATPFLSPTEEVEAQIKAISQLPPRHAFWWDRRVPWSAVQLRTATLDLGNPKSLDGDLRDAVKAGTLAVSIGELTKAMADEEARLNALARRPPTLRAVPASRAARATGQQRGGLPW